MEEKERGPRLHSPSLCEEGEEAYEEEYLKRKDMAVLRIEEPEQLDTTFFRNCEKNYHPAQVVIEFNGMYLANMRNVAMEQLAESELIVVNRCPEGMDRSGFRRALKVQNPMSQLIFEDLKDHIIEPSEEDLPYEIKGDMIEVGDMDFGIWYVDAYEHPEHYLHKEIHFLAQAFRPKGMEEIMFVPVRKIMTCCAADIRFYGYPCISDGKIEFVPRGWVHIQARFEYKSVTGSGSRQPVLHLSNIVPA